VTELEVGGYIRSGLLEIRDPARFHRGLRSFRDGEVFVRVQRAYATRTARQNRYYWGVVIDLISEHTGHTPNETHEILKQMFLPKKTAVQDRNGVIVAEFVLGGTTTRLTTREFEIYLREIKQFALEQLEVLIPDPL
jgi:hypothetical protein